VILLRARSFTSLYAALCRQMRDAPGVPQKRWQGRDVTSDPSARTYELTNVAVDVDLGGVESLDHWRADCAPNLPWADDHFLERVGGEPLNPGAEWKNWPWGKSADTFREDGLFNHTYAERLWPRWARGEEGGVFDERWKNREGEERKYPSPAVMEYQELEGIDRRLGDLQDLVELLVADPYTRQAYIPLFFPEDTGTAHAGRRPCTLGYQFILRADALHVYYPMRSCDLVRHFRDDCYLCIRLLIWILERCRARDAAVWSKIKTGMYTMHCTSLHAFENDRRAL
jgi:thymidylate synthase